MARKDINTEMAADDAAIEAFRAKFGDVEAAKLAADLYRMRRTPPPAPAVPSWSGLPRGVVVLIAIWVGLLETADKLPRLLLTVPLYEATLADYKAKMMQPELMQAQVEKAQYEAAAAGYLPAKSASEAEMAKVNAKYAEAVGKYP